MDAKDFIFPGVILALVIVIALGLLLTHSDEPTLVPTNLGSSTTVGTPAPSASSASASSTPTANPTGTSAQPYGSVTLALGQAASFTDGLLILPMRILEDSRCPADVQCIQAGTVKISFSAVVNGKTATKTVSIGQSVRVDGDTIVLDAVAPQKTKSGYPAPSEYRFTFTVTHS